MKDEEVNEKLHVNFDDVISYVRMQIHTYTHTLKYTHAVKHMHTDRQTDRQTHI